MRNVLYNLIMLIQDFIKFGLLFYDLLLKKGKKKQETRNKKLFYEPITPQCTTV